MDDGILDVSLLPAWSPSSVRAALTAALSRSTLLQAGIGYWTIDSALLGPDLLRAVQHESGFVCVDLHPPTEVEALAALAAQGGHVRVYYEDIPTYTDQGRKEPPCLLHSKMLVFWTKRAILGLNVEASLIVRLEDSSPLFLAAAEYLSRMKSIAEPFDVAKVEFYKELQRKLSRGLAPVMELEAEDGGSVGDTTITVFGTDRTELRRLGTVRREVHVALLDPGSDEQFLYPATILHSGLLSTSDASAGGISFSPRRHALRQGRQFARLRPTGPVEQTVLDTAEYFVTVRLGTRDPSLIADYAPSRAAILEEVSEDASPLLSRLDAQARTALFGAREIRVRRPAAAADEARPRTVVGRRGLPEHPVVSMRVLRPE